MLDDVTIEVNGDDSAKASDSIERPTDQFQPTDKWQQVKDGKNSLSSVFAN